MKNLCLWLCIAVMTGCVSYVPSETTPIAINFDGNAYLKTNTGNAKVNRKGLNFTLGDSASLYFKVSSFGKLDLALVTDSTNRGARVSVKVGEKSISQLLDADTVYMGTYAVADSGYLEVSFVTDRPTLLQSLLVGGSATEGAMVYVKDFSTYWGRRGPSVHLKYEMPKESTTQWFYNEVTVPEGADVMHSYFMANGFAEGYFGMQVNSETERRVLFSVWSPFDTQDPKQIPDDQKIRLLRKGEGVYVGEFGNEGSGGQSFLRYMWKAGNTYRFLNEVRPDGKGNTIYTAYFFAADENRWRLIASFLRPQTDTYYRGAHSFLENFSPEGGYKQRRVLFSNAWFISPDRSQWIYANNTTFTHDATAAAGVRKDYAGGVTSGGFFFLKNCGFFDDYTPYGTKFSSQLVGRQPGIDFDALEKL